MNEVVVQAYGLRYVVDEGSKFIVEESYEPFMKDLVKLDSGDVFIDVVLMLGNTHFMLRSRLEIQVW